MDECSTYGNGCPQLCSNVKGSFKCQCASGFKDSKGQGHDCKPEGNYTYANHRITVQCNVYSVLLVFASCVLLWHTWKIKYFALKSIKLQSNKGRGHDCKPEGKSELCFANIKD